MTNREIIKAIEEYAPLSLQMSWDNSGWQIGDPDAECTGVLICVDVTPAILTEAVEKGCNLIISHHPLIFRGVTEIIGRNRVQRCIARALRDNITVYSSHTATDCAMAGVSYEMASRLGLENIEVLDSSGLGAIGDLKKTLTWQEFAGLVKTAFGADYLRCSRPPFDDWHIGRVAMCGGSGAEFITEAIDRGAQAYITADCKLNWFIDYADDILLIDSGHFETEECTKDIFYRVICEKFPNFAVWKSTVERNPVMFV